MIRQKRLYEWSSYAMTGEGHVSAVVGDLLVLDETPFAPAHAGHEGDLGTVDGHEVLASVVLADGRTVAHEVEGSDDFRVGQRVYAEVEPFRRFSLMKNSAAADLTTLSLLDLGVPIRGVEVSAGGASIELEKPVAIDVVELTADVNAAIAARLPIRLGPPRAGGERLSHVEGFGLLLGWGPRVAKTNEIGGVRLAARPEPAAARRIECSLTRGIGVPVPHLFRRTDRADARPHALPPGRSPK